jgi:hypothetical protein
MKWLLKMTILLGYVLGFLTAAHWNDARDYYFKVTPFSNSDMEDTVSDIKDGIKNKIKSKINSAIADEKK